MGEPSCLVGDRSGPDRARPYSQPFSGHQTVLPTVRPSLTWGFATPQIPPYPPQHPTPQHPFPLRILQYPQGRCPRRGTKKGRVVGFSSRGFPFRSNSVLGCCPSCRWGEPSYLVSDRSGTNSARPVAQRRDHRQKARSRARSSLTWGFAAPQIPSYPPSTPDPRHQIAPPGIPVPPVRAPLETVPERLRTGPGTAVHPASDGARRA